MRKARRGRGGGEDQGRKKALKSPAPYTSFQKKAVRQGVVI